MKQKTTSRMMLVLIGLTLLIASTLTVQAATYTYSYETFGTPDVDNANPYSDAGELAYTYAEFGWSGGTAAVNTTLDSTGRFYINTSTTGADGWANFTLNTSYAYDYFEFSFKFINEYTLEQNHSGLEFRLRGDVGDIVFIRVYGANTTVDGSANRVIVLDYNSVEVANVSITKAQWYTVRLDPDYDSWDNNIVVTVYDVTAVSYIINEELGLNSNTVLTKFYMGETPASATVCIMVDNLVLLQTVYTTGESTVNYLAEYIIPILYAIAMFVVVITMLTTGTVTPETLITTLVVAIVGFVALMIITTI